MPYKVFVSHSMNEADRKAIEECEKQAKKHQIEFYLAENDTQPGASLAQKIKDAIKSCDAFVVFLTTDGTASHYVNQEIGVACECGKPVIPIVEKRVHLEGFLVGKEYIEFDRANLQNVADRLTARLVTLKSNSEDIEAHEIPVVVNTDPVNGALVDPFTDSISVTFSTEMRPESCSYVMAAKGEFPAVIGKPRLSADKRTYVVKVSLEPNRTYAMWLNSRNHLGFTSVSSKPAKPFFLSFETGDDCGGCPVDCPTHFRGSVGDP